MGVHFHSQFRNPLAYPAGYAPGFDPSHPAAVGISSGHGFSGVAQAGGFVSLVSGARGTPNASVLSSLNARGPFAVIDATSKRHEFPGQSTVNDVAVTFAAIAFMPSVGANRQFFSTSNTALTGIQFATASSSLLYLRFVGGGLSLTSSFPQVANVPYFIACSAIQDGSNFLHHNVTVNLLTGVITRDGVLTTASTGPAAPGGTYCVGDGPAALGADGARIHAVMFAPSHTSPADLAKWATDPWSFWYPNPGDNWIAAQAAGGFPYWGVQNNNFVIGTGIQ